MRLIIGLGNPGKEYEKTRHNAGFCVMDALASEFNVSLSTNKFKALINTVMIHGEKVIFMKPQTFMNLSGEALIQVMKFYQLEPKDILVIYDDMALPVGKIRLREKGSAGGQNGMKNIIQHLHTQEFPRIRIGIGKEEHIPVVDYVLGKVKKEDLKAFEESIQEAKNAVIYAMNHSFMDTMSAFNKK